MTFQRYAVYYVPDGPLADFGAAWFGWDVRSGAATARPDVEGLPVPISSLTAAPRKYGLHGTLKAPFRLADASDEAALSADLARLAATLPAASSGGLEPTRLSRFLALTPTGETQRLAELAAALVERLDHHRAPLSEEERARRKPAALSAEETRLLERWGYPYVMERYRFHITLTGRVNEADGDRALDALAPVLRPLCAPRFVVDQIALVGEGDDGMFRLIRRYPLGG